MQTGDKDPLFPLIDVVKDQGIIVNDDFIATFGQVLLLYLRYGCPAVICNFSLK